jgi:hypothetical protein
VRALLAFFGLLRPKSKMENGYLFAINFAWCLVPFCKMMGQNSKKNWVKWGTKHTLNRKSFNLLQRRMPSNMFILKWLCMIHVF